jgi:hypothetical protein
MLLMALENGVFFQVTFFIERDWALADKHKRFECKWQPYSSKGEFNEKQSYYTGIRYVRTVFGASSLFIYDANRGAIPSF